MSLLLLFEESSHQGIDSDDDFENDLFRDTGKQFRARGTLMKFSSVWRKEIIMWNCVLVVMALFFFSAAYVQHNDPDPYFWMHAYLVPFFINFAIIFASYPTTTKSSVRFWKIINWISTIHVCYCYTLGFWTLTHFICRQIWSDDDGHVIAKMVSEENMSMEEAKELLGLCLVIAWLSFVKNRNFLRFGVKGIIFGITITGLPIVSWILVEILDEKRKDQKCFTGQ